jgi:hypothetical protein
VKNAIVFGLAKATRNPRKNCTWWPVGTGAVGLPRAGRPQPDPGGR